MNEPNETPNSPPVEDPPSLVTTPPTTPEPDQNTDPDNKGTPEPKQPDQEPDDSPIVEPLSPTDITIPDGLEVDESLRDEFLAVLNNQELDRKGRAQALINLQVKAATEASEKASQLWSDTQKEWQDAVKADPEVGGDKLQPALARIGKLLTEFGTEELNGVFDLTGAGNNVHVIKFLDKLAQNVTEGGPATGQPTAQQASAASRLFPSMKG